MEETLLLMLDDDTARKGDFDDLVYLIELTVDRQRAVFRMRRSFFRTCHPDQEFSCDFVLKVKTLGKRAYPVEDDEQDEDITTEKTDILLAKQALNLAMMYPDTVLLVSNPPFPDRVHQVHENNVTNWEVLVAYLASGRMKTCAHYVEFTYR
ncbi:unnamed protein product [Clavelina lepadiformis]|uniref:Uncharacterized protein n=1 Tax=Clavelina lepadiformis TaxID=159417 RepID=A0ABP0GY09_CLALP